MSAKETVPHIEIPLCWKSPELATGRPFNWHRDDISAVRRIDTSELFWGPKVYRWLLRSRNNEIEACYIGESVNFYKRLQDYRRRFKKADGKEKGLIVEMKKCEQGGGSVSLELFDPGPNGFVLNGMTVNKQTLGNHEVRLVIEAVSIGTFLADHPSVPLINSRRTSASARAVSNVMKQIPRFDPATLRLAKGRLQALMDKN